MLQGHGDDICQYPDILVNFSSNIYAHADMRELKEHLCRHISLIDHYPEPVPCSLELMIARKHDVPADCVIVTNGATEAIYLIAQALVHQGVTRYSTGSVPTFSEYGDACRMMGMKQQEEAADGETVLWLCNPNNPTGSICLPEEITELAGHFSMVIVDQSYEDYTLATLMAARQVVQTSNIIQIHSLTKTYAIPGLRLGYIIAPTAVAGMLRRFGRPWSVNALAIEAGKWLLVHDVKAVPDLAAYLSETQRLRNQLNQLPGIHVEKTDTHFMLASIDYSTAARLKEWLVQRHRILIRDASNFRGLTPHHFRVSTQIPSENDLLVSAISLYRGQR